MSKETPALIRINDKELHKQAKMQAAKEGIKLYELVEAAIRAYIQLK